MPFLPWAGLYHADDDVVEETLLWSSRLWKALERVDILRWDNWPLDEWRKCVLFGSNIWQREIFVGLGEGDWKIPIPPMVLGEVEGSHGGPFTTNDTEDIMYVERANMHQGSLNMGQPYSTGLYIQKCFRTLARSS